MDDVRAHTNSRIGLPLCTDLLSFRGRLPAGPRCCLLWCRGGQQAAYRNDADDVYEFFEERHKVRSRQAALALFGTPLRREEL